VHDIWLSQARISKLFYAFAMYISSICRNIATCGLDASSKHLLDGRLGRETGWEPTRFNGTPTLGAVATSARTHEGSQRDRHVGEQE
jgi:hypothetical protein